MTGDLAQQIRAKLDSMVEGSGNLQSCAGCEYDCNCQAYVDYQGALLAVLDITDPDRGGGHLDCDCPTCVHKRVLVAAAKALGIEDADG